MTPLPPPGWFWSHDIRPDQVGSLLTPGTRLVRLSSYGAGDARRFAALVYQEPGAGRGYLLDVDAAALDASLRDTGTRPVAVTVDPAGGRPRFSVVLETGPAGASRLHIDLDEAGLRALVAGGGRIVDVATYPTAGGRRYAAVVGAGAEPCWLFTGVDAGALRAGLRRVDATLTRLRGYVEDGERLYTAVADRTSGGRWAWYPDLDADGVAGRLEAERAYPVDLDATRDDRGVRFSVVMRR